MSKRVSGSQQAPAVLVAVARRHGTPSVDAAEHQRRLLKGRDAHDGAKPTAEAGIDNPALDGGTAWSWPAQNFWMKSGIPLKDSRKCQEPIPKIGSARDSPVKFPKKCGIPAQICRGMSNPVRKERGAMHWAEGEAPQRHFAALLPHLPPLRPSLTEIPALVPT